MLDRRLGLALGFQRAGIIQFDIGIEGGGIEFMDTDEKPLGLRRLTRHQSGPSKPFQQRHIGIAQRSLHGVLVKPDRLGMKAALQAFFRQGALGIGRADHLGLALLFAIAAPRVGRLRHVGTEAAHAVAAHEIRDHGEDDIGNPYRQQSQHRKGAQERGPAHGQNPQGRAAAADHMHGQGDVDQEDGDIDRREKIQNVQPCFSNLPEGVSFQ